MAQLYKEFRPTQFDHAGLGLEDQQNWLVVGVSQTRDSEALEKSNFRTALEILGGESDTCEVHRFGHWGPGWFEIILVHPDRESEVDGIESALADYPVLSDEDFAALESEENFESWQHGAQREWAEKLGRVYELSDTTVEFLQSAEPSYSLHWHDEHSNDSDPWNTRYLDRAATPTRDEIAALIRMLRGVSHD
jgi:hypothetical protein